MTDAVMSAQSAQQIRAVALTAVHPSCLQLSVQVPSCCGMPHVHATYLTHIEGSTEEQLLHSWPEHFLHLHDAEDIEHLQYVWTVVR